MIIDKRIFLFKLEFMSISKFYLIILKFNYF